MIEYPTNLTDKQWQVIKNIVETKQRKRRNSLRSMMNAIMYITKTGCQWRMLPKEFGSWQTVYFYFRKWKIEGIFEEMMHHLRNVVRKSKGTDPRRLDYEKIIHICQERIRQIDEGIDIE